MNYLTESFEIITSPHDPIPAVALVFMFAVGAFVLSCLYRAIRSHRLSARYYRRLFAQNFHRDITNKCTLLYRTGYTKTADQIFKRLPDIDTLDDLPEYQDEALLFTPFQRQLLACCQDGHFVFSNLNSKP